MEGINSMRERTGGLKKMKEKTRDNRKWDPTAGNLEEN